MSATTMIPPPNSQERRGRGGAPLRIGPPGRDQAGLRDPDQQQDPPPGGAGGTRQQHEGGMDAHEEQSQGDEPRPRSPAELPQETLPPREGPPPAKRDGTTAVVPTRAEMLRIPISRSGPRKLRGSRGFTGAPGAARARSVLVPGRPPRTGAPAPAPSAGYVLITGRGAKKSRANALDEPGDGALEQDSGAQALRHLIRLWRRGVLAGISEHDGPDEGRPGR